MDNAEGDGAPSDSGGKRPRKGADKRKSPPVDFGKLGEMFERYTLIYGTTEVWDAAEKSMVTLQAFRAAYSGGLAKQWIESPMRKTLPRSAVVFDPGREPDGLHINLFRGWGVSPAPGKCDALLGLLRALCGTDEVFEYVANWIAYPLQYPGFKLRTALVFHGQQGVGKNLLWEAVGMIYGEHFSVIGQQQIESKFNGWASGRLLVIADEILTRAELGTTKGTIKAMITSPTIQVEEKQLALRKEENRMNIVFFSNEAEPVKVEDGDRRFLVVWCDDKRPREFYDAVADERDKGGVAALHQWLLKRDLTGFNPYGAPPMTEAKANLIEVGRTSPMGFAEAWRKEQIPGLPLVPARTTDLHQAYMRWCNLIGDRFPWNITRFVGEIRRAVPIARKRVQVGLNTTQAQMAMPDGLAGWEAARGDAGEAKFYGDYAEQFAEALRVFKRSDLNGQETNHAV